MNQLARLLAVAVCSVMVVGCAPGGEALTEDASFFEGLDEAVVREILTHPVARQKIEEEPDTTRESLSQGIAINFVVCRDALHVYQAWIHTGVAPSLAPLPTPTYPRKPSYSHWKYSYSRLEAKVESGEIGQLRFWLTAQGSCGRWIPATPEDPSGPTIRDIVLGQS